MATSSLYITPFAPVLIAHEFPKTNIETYSSEAVFAEDGITPIGSKFVISGTILMVEEDWSAISNALGKHATRCAVVSLTNSVQPLIDFTSGNSNIGGPFVKLSGTEVVGGGGVMLARFEINDEISWCTTMAVLSHTWTQKFTLNEAQMLSRSVSGALKIRRSSTSTSMTYAVPTGNAWTTTGPTADLYRMAIVPPVIGYGWRRKSQEFALDSASTTLLYTIQDDQYLHDLPPEVRVGDMDFSYERSATDAGVGHVSVTVELEASLALKNTMSSTGSVSGNRYLVATAVALSKARIDANFGGTLITRMKITENRMLSGFSIRFELDAMVYPTDTGGATPVLYPLATMVGRFFEINNNGTGGTCADSNRNPNPYGPAVKAGLPSVATVPQRWSMVPHYKTNSINGMNCAGTSDPLPKASLFTYNDYDADCPIATSVIMFEQGKASVNAMNTLFSGQYQGDTQQLGAETGSFVGILAKSTVITQLHYDTGMIRLPTMYLNKPDVVLQLGKPFVTVKERTEIVRANIAPSRVMRPLHADAFLISEDWNCNYGQVDTQGNRVFTAVYERTYGLYDRGTSSEVTPPVKTIAGFYTRDASIRAWGSPFGILLPPLTGAATSASQGTAISVLGTYAPESGLPIPAVDASYGTQEMPFKT
jgi:hypothetical protein